MRNPTTTLPMRGDGSARDNGKAVANLIFLPTSELKAREQLGFSTRCHLLNVELDQKTIIIYLPPSVSSIPVASYQLIHESVQSTFPQSIGSTSIHSLQSVSFHLSRYLPRVVAIICLCLENISHQRNNLTRFLQRKSVVQVTIEERVQDTICLLPPRRALLCCNRVAKVRTISPLKVTLSDKDLDSKTGSGSKASRQVKSRFEARMHALERYVAKVVLIELLLSNCSSRT